MEKLPVDNSESIFTIKSSEPVKKKSSKKYKKEKKRDLKLMRKAGGEIWEDKTLDEWDQNDYRIF